MSFTNSAILTPLSHTHTTHPSYFQPSYIDMEVVQSSASSSTSLLHRLPAALFVLVTQHLPLPDKLLHLTHVCRTLPSLTPLSFAFDTLAWTPRLLSHLTSTPPSPLLSLLSLVPSALFVDADSPFVTLLCHLLHPPAGPTPFPALRAVTIVPSSHSTRRFSELGQLVAFSLRLCPHLTALDLQLRSVRDEDHEELLTQLTQLPSLRCLRLRETSMRMSSRALLVLLSLPLTALDLRSVGVTVNTAPPFLLLVSSTLRTLLLPTLFEPYQQGGAHVFVGQWERALLSSFGAEREDGAGRLRRLLLPTIATSSLSCLPLLCHLHTLQLDANVSNDDQDVAAFLTSLASQPRSLKHLRLRLRLRSANALFFWPHGFFPALTAFISAYTGQLETLELLNQAPHDSIPHRDRAEALTVALLSCHSLRRLQVQLDWLSPLPSTTLSHSLPHLEALELRSDHRLNESMLAVLLDAAPQLRELTLEAPPLPWDVLPWVGDRVHELRTLVVTTTGNVVTQEDLVLMSFDRWRPPATGPALPHLTTLIFGSSPVAPHDEKVRVFFLTHLTAYLVHSAPALRYLTFPLHDWLDGYRQPLALLAELSELKGISVRDSWRRGDRASREWLREDPLGRYWEEEGNSSRVQRGALDTTRCLWGEEAWPSPGSSWTDMQQLEMMRGVSRGEEEVLAGLSSAMPRFRAEVDGVPGSVAFFAALKSQPISDFFLAPLRASDRLSAVAVGGSVNAVREEDVGKQCCVLS